MLSAHDGRRRARLVGLRSIAYGASPITTTALKPALKTFGCPLFQLYGLTETTGAIVQLDADDHDPDGPREHLLRSAGALSVDGAEDRRPDAGEERPSRRARRDPRPRPGGHARLLRRARGGAAAVFDDDGWLRTGDGG